MQRAQKKWPTSFPAVESLITSPCDNTKLGSWCVQHPVGSYKADTRNYHTISVLRATTNTLRSTLTQAGRACSRQ